MFSLYHDPRIQSMLHIPFSYLFFIGCSAQNPISGLYELYDTNPQNQIGYVYGTSSDVYIYISHPNIATNGWQQTEIEIESEGGFWAFFDIETAMDTAQAALRIQGSEARLPLGARRGEFDLVFEMKPSTKQKQDIDISIEKNTLQRQQHIENQRQFWSLQKHVLVEQIQNTPQIVGIIDWEQEQIDVFDATWYTSSPQNFEKELEGGDILLRFDVEPSFQGEQALIRCNIIKREVTIPSSIIPSVLDRRLYLMEPTIDLDLQLYKKEAQMKAKEAEYLWITENAHMLQQSLQNDCMSWKDQSILDSWLGYRFETKKTTEGCHIEIIPDPPQHQRYFQGIINHVGTVIPQVK